MPDTPALPFRKRISLSPHDLDQLAVNTIRTLAMDAVEAANSGHPGTPMALAPVAYTLFNERLVYDVSDPAWPARDRFVLSCGHASMLLYAVLHLAEVAQLDASGRPTGEPAVPLEHLRNFRQLHSRCPGHPEQPLTSGIETTTGPLGQGLGNSVGMAIAARWLSARFDRPGFDLFGFRVWTLASDGDLMEGVGAEAASLAGHLGLANLCWIYDDNRITIEGQTRLAFSEDVAQRFAGYGWRIEHVSDVNDLAALRAAYDAFESEQRRPTLIVVRSHIAWGAPNKQDTHDAHGAPLGAEEVRLTKQAYGWPADAAFFVPDEVRRHFRTGIGQRGRASRQAWDEKLAAYRQQHPQLAAQWDALNEGTLPAEWDRALPTFPADAKGLATRVSSGKVLNAVAREVPWLLGGSADLAPSTKTTLTFDEAGGAFSAENPAGRNFHFGIREHAMAAALNGLALCGLRPFGATFLVFSDYCRPSIRLSAIMSLPAIYIFTHDSIGVGEDGPTHQPIEHLAALRAIPRLVVIRPGDASEVVETWRTIVPWRDRPVALALTRQDLPTLDRSQFASAEGARRGAYILAEPPQGPPRLILIGTGSELSLCVDAWQQLAEAGIAARLVSMPSWELFDEQDEAYRRRVLPDEVPARLAVEAGIAQGWERYLGPRGRFLGLAGFGESAPARDVYRHFGLTVEAIVAAARRMVLGETG